MKSSITEAKITSFNLTSEKKDLLKELEFAPNVKALQEIRKYPGPNYFFTEELIENIKSSSHRKRIIDSLNTIGEDVHLSAICSYILYKATKEEVYKQNFVSNVTFMTNNIEENEFIGPDHRALLSSPIWDNKTHAVIAKTLFKSKDKHGNPFKESVLITISMMAFVDSFSLHDNDYNLYWDYLKVNRDIFMSPDSIFNKTQLLTNIASFSPQLYMALYYKYLPEAKSGYADLQVYALLQSATQNYLPFKKNIELSEFNNNLTSNNHEAVIPSTYYIQNKKIIDVWLYGDFEKFKSNKEEFKRAIENKTF